LEVFWPDGIWPLANRFGMPPVIGLVSDDEVVLPSVVEVVDVVVEPVIFGAKFGNPRLLKKVEKEN
jgi:hypothetical protein